MSFASNSLDLRPNLAKIASPNRDTRSIASITPESVVTELQGTLRQIAPVNYIPQGVSHSVKSMLGSAKVANLLNNKLPPPSSLEKYYLTDKPCLTPEGMFDHVVDIGAETVLGMPPFNDSTHLYWQSIDPTTINLDDMNAYFLATVQYVAQLDIKTDTKFKKDARMEPMLIPKRKEGFKVGNVPASARRPLPPEEIAMKRERMIENNLWFQRSKKQPGGMRSGQNGSQPTQSQPSATPHAMPAQTQYTAAPTASAMTQPLTHSGSQTIPQPPPSGPPLNAPVLLPGQISSLLSVPRYAPSPFVYSGDKKTQPPTFGVQSTAQQLPPQFVGNHQQFQQQSLQHQNTMQGYPQNQAGVNPQSQSAPTSFVPPFQNGFTPLTHPQLFPSQVFDNSNPQSAISHSLPNGESSSSPPGNTANENNESSTERDDSSKEDANSDNDDDYTSSEEEEEEEEEEDEEEEEEVLTPAAKKRQNASQSSARPKSTKKVDNIGGDDDDDDDSLVSRSFSSHRFGDHDMFASEFDATSSRRMLEERMKKHRRQLISTYKEKFDACMHEDIKSSKLVSKSDFETYDNGEMTELLEKLQEDMDFERTWSDILKWVMYGPTGFKAVNEFLFRGWLKLEDKKSDDNSDDEDDGDSRKKNRSRRMNSSEASTSPGAQTPTQTLSYEDMFGKNLQRIKSRFREKWKEDKQIPAQLYIDIGLCFSSTTMDKHLDRTGNVTPLNGGSDSSDFWTKLTETAASNKDDSIALSSPGTVKSKKTFKKKKTKKSDKTTATPPDERKPETGGHRGQELSPNGTFTGPPVMSSTTQTTAQQQSPNLDTSTRDTAPSSHSNPTNSSTASSASSASTVQKTKVLTLQDPKARARLMSSRR